MDRYGYLTGWLLEMGAISSGGMSGAPLAWSEIAAWAQLRGLELSPFEVQAIRAMSEEYVSMLNRISDGDAPPPYLPEGSTYWADLNKKMQRGLDAMVTKS